MTRVVGDTAAIQKSFLHTWLHRAEQRVESSPEAHVAEMVNGALKSGVLSKVDDTTSDGFHTFGELYRHRLLLTAALFRTWAAHLDMPPVFRSKRHHDGAEPFDDPNWFIVVAELPTGQISYHYEMQHWDLFAGVLVVDRAPEWDGHTAAEAALRLHEWIAPS